MKYFGTDGIRGHAFDTLPLITAYKLGVAVKTLYPDHLCIIAHDTRISSKEYVQAFLEGFHNENFSYLGIVPTPILAYESLILDTIGVMITASHNPYYDNGLKLFFKGQKLDHHRLLDIEKVMDKVSSYQMGQIIKLNPSWYHYDDLYQTLEFKQPNLKYLVDTANGAASYVIKDYLQGDIIFNKPDGYNINASCGATHLEALKSHMKGYDIGFSLDGDGDRMLMVIDDKVIEGDEILYVMIKDHLLNNIQYKVSLSIMTNPGVLIAFESMGIQPHITQVGDHYILEAIKEGVSDCGAEASGHIITPFLPIGDGILAIKYVLDIIHRRGLSTVNIWLNDIKKRPMVTKNVKLPKSLLSLDNVKAYVNRIKNDLKKHEVFIIRASGTEDLIRITVSKENESDVMALIEQTIAILEGQL